MRAFVAWSIGLACGMFSFAIAAGLTGSLPGAIAAAAAVTGLVAWATSTRPIVPLDGAACSRGLKLLGGAATVVALVQLARLTVFMADPSRPGYSMVPFSDWEVRHSCVSAYYVAARAADHVPDVYADSLYSSPDDDPTKIRKALTIGQFKVDVYEYPPSFLIVPRGLLLLAPEFDRFRTVWFGVNAAVVLLAFLVLARWLGPAAGTRALLLSPLLWASPPTLSMLQKGNVQGFVIALSVLAMALFERRRWVAGGALLAHAIASKLYPGLLLVYLVARWRWRAVLWTALFGIAWFLVTLVDLGWAPYRAFLGHLPGLMSGEAFPAFRNPMAMASNFSVPGMMFKLKLFGVSGVDFETTKIVGWIYTLIATGVVVAVSRREVSERQKPLMWLAIIILATLRSPFLPPAYAAVPALALLALLGATYAPTPRTLGVVLLTWVALSISWPLDKASDPRLFALLMTIPQVATIAVAIAALRKSTRPRVPSEASD